MLKRNSFIRQAGKAFALSAVVAGTLQAQNVTLQLSNGDQITGQIVLQNTNQVTLSNAWAKAIVIPLAEIKSRKTNAPVAVANAPVAKTNAPAAKPAAAAKPAPKPVVATAPKPAPRPKPDWTKDWHGDVQIGTDVGLGEARRELYYGRFKITYAPVARGTTPGNESLIDRFRNIFEYNAAYGTTDGQLSANRMDGSSKTDFDVAVGKRFFVYNLAGAGYDEIRRIDIRYEVGPGVGYHLFKTTNFVMNVEAGLNYQAQYFDNDTTTERVYYRFAEDATWTISKTLTFDEKFEIFPEVNFDQYRIRFESNLRYWLWENLSFNLTVLDTYDTQVAPHVDPNDLQIRSSIGLKF